jgi:hypothetical protein
MPPAPHLHARAHHHLCAQGADGACVQHRIGRVELWRVSLGARNTRGVAVSKARPGRGASVSTLLLCLVTLLLSRTPSQPHGWSTTGSLGHALLCLAPLLCLFALFLLFSVLCSISHTRLLSHLRRAPLIIRVLISMGRSNRWNLNNHTNLTATLTDP